MNNLRFLLLIAFFCLTIPILSFTEGQEEEEIIDFTTFENLKTLIESQSKDYYLIDVRTIEEYESGHIPSAFNIPYQNIGQEIPSKYQDELIIVYCRSGGRSARAEETLRNKGFSNVHDFGGVSKWEGDLVKGPPPALPFVVEKTESEEEGCGCGGA